MSKNGSEIRSGVRLDTVVVAIPNAEQFNGVPELKVKLAVTEDVVEKWIYEEIISKNEILIEEFDRMEYVTSGREHINKIRAKRFTTNMVQHIERINPNSENITTDKNNQKIEINNNNNNIQDGKNKRSTSTQTEDVYSNIFSSSSNPKDRNKEIIKTCIRKFNTSENRSENSSCQGDACSESLKKRINNYPNNSYNKNRNNNNNHKNCQNDNNNNNWDGIWDNDNINNRNSSSNWLPDSSDGLKESEQDVWNREGKWSDNRLIIFWPEDNFNNKKNSNYQTIIGFDTESPQIFPTEPHILDPFFVDSKSSRNKRFTRPPSLLQLSTHDSAILIRLYWYPNNNNDELKQNNKKIPKAEQAQAEEQFCGRSNDENRNKRWKKRYLSKSWPKYLKFSKMPYLRFILTSPLVLKTGFEMKHELSILEESYGIKMASAFDLTRDSLTDEKPNRFTSHGGTYGMEQAVRKILKYSEFKKDRDVQCSDWSATNLNVNQIEYAALDSYFSLLIHLNLHGDGNKIEDSSDDNLEGKLRKKIKKTKNKSIKENKIKLREKSLSEDSKDKVFGSPKRKLSSSDSSTSEIFKKKKKKQINSSKESSKSKSDDEQSSEEESSSTSSSHSSSSSSSSLTRLPNSGKCSGQSEKSIWPSKKISRRKISTSSASSSLSSLIPLKGRSKDSKSSREDGEVRDYK